MDPTGEANAYSSPAVAANARAESMDTSDTYVDAYDNMKGAPLPPYYGGRSYAYAPPSFPASIRAPIKSCVTTSFEEREDRIMERRDPTSNYSPPEYGMRHGYSPPVYSNVREDYYGMEPSYRGYYMERGSHSFDREPHAYSRDLPPIRESDIEQRHPPHEMRSHREARVPPSPRGEGSYINRSFSNASSLGSSYRGGPLKRSFWHHAKRGDDYPPQSLPTDFMPPTGKRNKITPPTDKKQHERHVMARAPYSEEQDHFSRSPGWFSRAMSWEATRDEYYQREPSSRTYSGSWSSRSPPSSYNTLQHPTSWGDAPSMPSPPGRYLYHADPSFDMSPTQMNRWYEAEDRRGWGLQSRQENDSYRDGGGLRRESEMPMRFVSAPPSSTPQSAPPPPMMMTGALPMPSPERPNQSGILLLALPEDRISLSETLCLVRENVEIFEATIEDVEAPAPGRKHAVSVGQVGLRCLHCRHTARSSDRVKRAVCYPSSIKRIYRTVIDMKLDHFLHCKFVPTSLKDTLNALKANNTRSTGTTMQYFIRAAGTVGLVDSPDGNGVRMKKDNEAMKISSAPETPKSNIQSQPSSLSVPVATPDTANSVKEVPSPPNDLSMKRKDSICSTSSDPSKPGESDSAEAQYFTGQVSLSLSEDKTALSPLRCFLREHVVAFSASKEDVAVRTPTNFSVTEGQVGIACTHCFQLPAKMRLNRAVCFPFSICRIYQSVADIQRFHLAECAKAPPEVKAKFNQLQGESSKGSKGLATRQYWVTSAKKIGLVDTEKGIRFGRDPATPEKKSPSLDILAQVAFRVNSVNKPLVLPEDKPLVAAFLYTVMEQLQACRFTEADRNKRRLKNIGCIGVECKHCAGQVDGRKFFWSSVSAVESNFVSVHTHVMECKKTSAALKERLIELKKLRKEQTAALKTGSQKAFFSRVWERLNAHEKAVAAEEAAKGQDSQMKDAIQEKDSEAKSGEGNSQDTTLHNRDNMEVNAESKPSNSTTEGDSSMDVVSV